MFRHQPIRIPTQIAAAVAAIQLVLAGPAVAVVAPEAGANRQAAPSPQVTESGSLPKGSDQTYRVQWVSEVHIVVDGRADEPAWSKASVEKGFFFPWKKAPVPATEFRALCDESNFYFTFRVHDDDIFTLERLRDEEDEVFEDRVEIYFGRDEQMKDYYCLEVDSRGRAFDYRGAFPRQLDPKGRFEGLKTAATALPDGYEVEACIPVTAFAALGFPALRPGVKIRCGLYRAEFSHDRSGRVVKQEASPHNLGRSIEGPPPIEDWLSWVDPKTPEPDFHVPSSMGWLEIVK